MGIAGFNHRAAADIPAWAGLLNNYYWRIRVEGRNKAIRRKFYRLVKKEKLRLVEAGCAEEVVNAVCKYLVSLKEINAQRLDIALKTERKQTSLNFFCDTI